MTLSPGEISPDDFGGPVTRTSRATSSSTSALRGRAQRGSGGRVHDQPRSLLLRGRERGAGLDVPAVRARDRHRLRQRGRDPRPFSRQRGDYEALARELASHGVIAGRQDGPRGLVDRQGERGPQECRLCISRTSSTPTAPATPGPPASSTAISTGERFRSAERRLHHGIGDGPAFGPLIPDGAWAEVKKRVLQS
jgi:hypothetical protein